MGQRASSSSSSSILEEGRRLEKQGEVLQAIEVWRRGGATARWCLREALETGGVAGSRAAFERWKEEALAASDDESEKKVMLADALFYGFGCNMDHQQAAVWYERSDCPEGKAALGIMLCGENGFEKDLDRAVPLLEEAGCPRAMWYLSRLEYVAKRYRQGVALLEKAGDYPPALHFLGKHYEEGRGVEQDFFHALQLYEKAGAAGHYFALKAETRLSGDPRAIPYGRATAETFVEMWPYFPPEKQQEVRVWLLAAKRLALSRDIRLHITAYIFTV